MEYSKLASGQVSSVLTGAPTSVVLPFLPDFIEISNANRAVAASGVVRAWWLKDMGQGAAFVDTVSAGPVDGTSFISAATGGGFYTFQGALSLQFGPSLQVVSIVKATGIVTTAVNHNLVSGNVVIFQGLYQSPTTGMPQIAGIPFVVTVLSPTTFSINYNLNQSNFTAISGSPSGALVKKVLYPNLYAPQIGFIDALSLGSSTTVTTSAPTNVQVGQEVAFRIPSVYGTVQLNSLPNSLIPGSPLYGFVSAVNSSVQFVVNIDSSAYSAFNSNQPVSSVPGLNFPQVVPVGDNNTGSNQPNSNPPLFYNGYGTALVPSINGPAVAGAFCNNTSMGFIIGGSVSGTTGDVIYWRAYAHDLSL